MSAEVQLESLRRHFAGSERPAVDGISLNVTPGETVCLVGPSGCGKSTTLRMVAGLERPDSGTVRIDGKDMTRVPPQARDVAMVFQGFALYPHMRVRDIMAFPLKMQRVAAPERSRRVEEAAEMLGITRLLDRRPDQLSGGERQRVAMGRAIVRRPRVFLFDEPLSNLDAALRNELRVELGHLLRRLEATALYVTHDQAEAMTLGDRIAVINFGSIEQLASPKAIYQTPQTRFVASFFGMPPMNLVEGTRSGGIVNAGPFEVPAPETAAEGQRVVLGVRPEDLHVVSEVEGHEIAASAAISAVEPLGAETLLELRAEGDQRLRARLAGFETPVLGSTVTLATRSEHLRWFDAETGAAL